MAAALTQFVYGRGEDIIDHDQYADTDHERFFARLEWTLSTTGATAARLQFADAVAKPHGFDWERHFSDQPLRIGVMVTREMAHLYALLVPCLAGMWNASIPLATGDHPDLEPEARRLGIDHHHTPINGGNKAAQELRQLASLRDYRVDLVVLARYMQVVGPTLIDSFRNRIISIHHSLLPAFVGAKPYKQARDRGVKLIGATSHYVTADLDAGPIIAQDTTPVTHAKSVPGLINVGRELETRVLKRAVALQVRRRIIVHGNRTIVFD